MRQVARAVSNVKRIIPVFVLFLFPSVYSFSQPANDPAATKIRRLLDHAEPYYNVNEKLVNGFLYSLPDDRIDGHPYLEDDQWVPGTLFISGDIFDQVLLKYDLTRDDIILKARMANGKFKAIEMTHEHVDSFRLGIRLFVNSRKFTDRNEDMVYYEQILDKHLTYVRQHSKHFISQYDVLTPHGRYSNTETRNYFIDQGKLINVTGRRGFIRFFSKTGRNEIRKFLRKENIRYRNASDAELHRLLEYCNQIMSQ